MVLLPLTVSPQSSFKNIHFTNIKRVTTKAAITKIVQDESGMTWIGSFGSGLHRFDGINYVSYYHDYDSSTSINGNLIYDVFIDDTQKIWVGTDSGLNFYNPSLDNFSDVSLGEGDQIEHYKVNNIIEDNHGFLIVTTYDHGILKLNKKDYGLCSINYQNPSGKEAKFVVNDLIKSTNGDVYFGTTHGLMVLKQQEMTLRCVPLVSTATGKVQETSIESLLFDQEGRLVAGTSSQGIIKSELKEGMAYSVNYPFTHKKVFDIIAVDHTILVGTENEGLYLFDNRSNKILAHYERNEFNPKSIGSNSIWSLYADNLDRVWIGYYDAGIAVHDPLKSKFGMLQNELFDKNSLSGFAIKSMVKDQSDRLWVFVAAGLDRYDTNTGKFNHIIDNNLKDQYGQPVSRNIEGIHIDPNGNLWLASWDNGIYVLEKGRTNFVNYTMENTNGALKTNAIRGFAEDAEGNIWIALHLKGVQYYDPEIRSFHHFDSPSYIDSGIAREDVQVIITTKNNMIWAGTSNGLYRLDPSQKDTNGIQVTKMDNKMPKAAKNHPNVRRINTLYESAQGILWVGTKGSGLLMHDPDSDQLKFANQQFQLDDNTISAIIEDDNGFLWLAGSQGIYKIDTKNGINTQYTMADGLLTDNFYKSSVEKDGKGVLYFGSDKGINFIDPKRIVENKIPPKLCFTNLKLAGKTILPDSKEHILTKTINQTDTVQLEHDQSVFTIEYMGIGHTWPENHAYAYMLEGLDKNWNHVDNNRSATYTNLAAGEYTFKLKSANNDGYWTQRPLAMTIIKHPPWWRSKIAYVLYGLLIFIIVYGVIVFYKRRFKQKQLAILEKERRLDEKNLNQRKLQFFTNVSHEFRTPLTLIMNPISDLIKRSDFDIPEVIRQKHQIIYKNSERLSRLINELMDFRKLESNKMVVRATHMDLVMHSNIILGHFYEEANARNIDLRFNTSEPELMVWADQGMFEKIMFNLLSNAFKVTPENGKIEVHLKRVIKKTEQNEVRQLNTKDIFEISVSDNGPGIDQKEYDLIFKRFYQVGSLNKRFYGSTGVGLEMIKGFVELHKGQISVESNCDKGTTFKVCLKGGKEHFKASELNDTFQNFEPVPLKKKRLHSADIKQGKPNGQQHKKEHTLLLVEDDTQLLTYLKEELGKTYQVLSATNGQDALKITEDHDVDLVLTDVVMPTMDGLELCEKVKNDIKTSHIPILMFSAKSMVEDQLNGIDSGADIYIAKPFDIAVLNATIARTLASRRIVLEAYTKGISKNNRMLGTTLDHDFIKKIMTYVKTRVNDPEITVYHLASEFNLSRSQFYRKIKLLTGLTANQLIRKVRLEEAQKIIQSGVECNVNELAFSVGFSTLSYFIKCYKEEFGLTPKKALMQ